MLEGKGRQMAAAETAVPHQLRIRMFGLQPALDDSEKWYFQ